MLTLPLYCTGSNRSWVGPGLALYSVSIPQLRALDLDSVLVLYQMGHSKVFFIAGVLAQLEGDTKLTGSECLEKIWGKGVVPVVVHLLFDSSPIVPTTLP